MPVYEQRMRTTSSCDNIHKLLTRALNYNRVNAGGTANWTTDSDCRSEATYATPGSVLNFRVQQPYNTDTLSSTDGTLRSNHSLWTGSAAPPPPAIHVQSSRQSQQTAHSSASPPMAVSAHLLRTPKVQRRVSAPRPPLPLSQCSSTCSTLTRAHPSQAPPPACLQPSAPAAPFQSSAIDYVAQQFSLLATSGASESEAETSGSEALSDPASIEVAAARRHSHELFAKAQRLTEQSAQLESAHRLQEALLACSQGRCMSVLLIRIQVVSRVCLLPRSGYLRIQSAYCMDMKYGCLFLTQ